MEVTTTNQLIEYNSKRCIRDEEFFEYIFMIMMMMMMLFWSCAAFDASSNFPPEFICHDQYVKSHNKTQNNG